MRLILVCPLLLSGCAWLFSPKEEEEEPPPRNAAPTAPSILLSPAEATTDEPIEVVFTAESTDPDGDVVHYRFLWSEDGRVRDDLAGETIPASETEKGETWTVVVTPTDGEADGTTSTAEAVIVNSPPAIEGITFVPEAPTADDPVDAVVTASDADGDTVVYTYEWSVDGEVAPYTDSLLPAGAGARGETWTVTVTPSDGQDEGAAVEASVTFANSPPSISSVTLSPDPVGSDETLTASVSGSDPDGDSISYGYTWYVNGAALSATGRTLDGATWFDSGDEIYVEVTPSDGRDTGAAVASDPVVVDADTLSPEVGVSPEVPFAGEDLRCEVLSDTVEADGDAIRFTMSWTVDGVAYTGTDSDTWTGDTVPGEATLPGETWACTATASADGATTAESDAASVVIEADLVAWYPFDGDADDWSGNGLDGTLSGATSTSDHSSVPDLAYDFDGVNDSVTMGTTTFSTPISVALWFRSTATNNRWDTLFGWNATSGAYAGAQIMAQDDGRLRARIGDDGDDILTTSTPDGDGLWHQVTMTRDATGTVTLYVDGSVETTGSSTTSMGTSHTLYIGTSFAGEYFDGSIDDVRVYERALDASEAARLYAF